VTRSAVVLAAFAGARQTVTGRVREQQKPEPLGPGRRCSGLPLYAAAAGAVFAALGFAAALGAALPAL
jgi:hypothetical protein